MNYEETFIKDFAQALKEKKAQKALQTMQEGFRMYHAAKSSRLTADFSTSNTSADAELGSSLRPLRARSRALIRDAAYAKRAKQIVINNIVGTGIGMQAQVKNTRNRLLKKINDNIEDAWTKWCRGESCHTGGMLHFSDLERIIMGQIFEAGEIFIRKHYQAFGTSEVPLALEIIEPERVIDEFQPQPPPGSGTKVRMGVETNDYHRPVAYWIRRLHPGETHYSAYETDLIERVPAELIIHLRIIDRWPQTRGEPWLHAVARKLNDMDSYSEAELTAARGAACYMGFIENEQGQSFGQKQSDGSQQYTLEPGVIPKLLSGEKFSFVNPNRPNSQMDPFMRMMLREVAAGVGVSYESLSRDYSQSNYSSSRLALLDDRDLWRMLQQWFIRSFRDPLHREWLNLAVMSRAVAISVEDFAADMEKFAKARFKPRGWSWIDPTKEVTAYKDAVKCGFTTVSEVVALTAAGRDIEDLLDERKQELELMEQMGLEFETSPGSAKAQEPQNEPQPQADTGNQDEEEPIDEENENPRGRILALRRDA